MIDNKKLVAMFKDLGYVNSEGISNKSTRERAGIDRRLENELVFAVSQGIDKQFDKLTAGPRTDDDLKDFINSLRRMKLSEEQEEFCKITNTSIENIIEEAFKLKYKNALKDENTMFQDCILRMSEISGIGIDIESLKKEVHQERIAEKGMDNSGNFDPLSFLDGEAEKDNSADSDPLSFLDDEVRNNTADFDPLGFLDGNKEIIEGYFNDKFEDPLIEFYVEPKKESPVEDLNYTEKNGQKVLSNNGIGKQGEENNNIMLNLIPTEKTLLDKMEETGNPLLVAIANNKWVKGISIRLSAFRNRSQKLEKIEGNPKLKDFDAENKEGFGLGDPGVPTAAVARNYLARVGKSVMYLFEGITSLFGGKNEHTVDNKPNELLEPKAETSNPENNLGKADKVGVVAVHPNIFAVDKVVRDRTNAVGIEAGRKAAAVTTAQKNNRIITQPVDAKRTEKTELADHNDGPSL